MRSFLAFSNLNGFMVNDGQTTLVAFFFFFFSFANTILNCQILKSSVEWYSSQFQEIWLKKKGGGVSEFLFCIGSNRRAVFVIMCASLLVLTRKAFMLLADAPCLENHWLDRT